MDVHLEGQLPLLVGNILDRLERRLMGRVVDEDVDTAEFLDRLVDDRPAMGRVLDIAPHEHRLAARLLDHTLGILGVLILGEIGDQEIGALAGIGDRDCPADAAVAAGDHRLLAGKPARSAIGTLAVIRHRVHPAGKARHRLLLFGKGRAGIVRHGGILRGLVE
jgi:hypothetical protein